MKVSNREFVSELSGVHNMTVEVHWLFTGDVIVYDTLMVPLRPFRVLVNPGKTDEAVIDIAWSIDNTRLIIINTLVGAAC